MQKIVRVREGEPIRELDEYSETWFVVKSLGEAPRQEGQSEWVRWVYVLLERDEEDTALKSGRHAAYLAAVDRIVTPRA
jgi:hypothetical protein